LEGAIFDIFSKSYHAHSAVSDNTALIGKNYSMAFSGNRQLITQNTDDLFRNRLAIIQSLENEANTDLQTKYVDAVGYGAKVAILEHRALLNQHVLELTLRIAEDNARHNEIISRVMETNEEIVSFNLKYTQDNLSALEKGFPGVEQATAQAVNDLVAANAASVEVLHAHVAGDQATVAAVRHASDENSRKSTANSKLIAEQRKKIEGNRHFIQDHQQAIASRLSTK